MGSITHTPRGIWIKALATAGRYRRGKELCERRNVLTICRACEGMDLGAKQSSPESGSNWQTTDMPPGKGGIGAAIYLLCVHFLRYRETRVFCAEDAPEE